DEEAEGEHGAAYSHLQRATAEDGATELPELAHVELEPDEKEHEDDAELREAQDRLHVAHERKTEGPDRASRNEVTEHRSEARAFCERYTDDRCAEIDDRVAYEAALGRAGAHPSSASTRLRYSRACSSSSSSEMSCAQYTTSGGCHASPQKRAVCSIGG